ncbi:hypothetical protein SMGD1_1252 [Sulfurimonas gotlandica GD1]|uniref:Uncharacterized protein n=1 Tax=Sulfurimonas gotlandica (strain DSM 19862 / JCM 16533 / GD1) TaxID=929558 RepID=B6BGZ2_SULGG|nr:hypothetical protein [Sulfurimonas gotlandica]EDZ63645.1 hypothetical protein CBGD1_1265 [Sulfurimonas gotlandica GD1]EHP29776.1 hypothetical protein SMGD1_1252 [Sulfurimonas gotlandica GD1]
MFSKILGKMKSFSSDKNQEHRDLVEKISKMNLTDMRAYINNRVPDLQVNEDGLIVILNKLLEVDEKTSKRYIEIDDMDSKIKNGFDLVLSILTNKKVTVSSIELVNEFLEKSRDIIQKYDTENKQIYCSKFKDSISLAVRNMNAKSEFKNKLNVIGG